MKLIRILLTVVFAIGVISCDKKVDHKIKKKAAIVQVKDSVSDTIALKPVNSIFGHRFVISGDFDGDGKPENMAEHYYSRRDKKESYKFYDNVEEDWLVWDSIMKKRPYSFALSDNKNIDTLRISQVLQLYGIAYLKNEGDLNGDGTDEVSYVVSYADMSSMNTWHIVTYKNNKWQDLYSFTMWDWQLPELPGFLNVYGYFGQEKSVNVSNNDTLNQRLERELKAFPGLVKKISRNKVEIIYNKEGEPDTITVSLKRLK